MPDLQEFYKVREQLKAMREEIGHLSKKSPDGAVNKFKLGLTNKLLARANSLYESEYMPFEDFRQFDEDEMPTNSDVVIVLAQYIKCLDSQSSDNEYYLMEG